MATTNPNLLEEYIAQLQSSNQGYTPLTEAQIESKAKNRYQTLYDQNRLSAQQTYDVEKLARDQALATQLEQYALQMDQSAKNYQNAQADAVRSALGRGMQRSSYLGATVGNIGVKGAEAQQAILKNQQGTVKNYAAQQQLATNQLAQQLAQYDKAQLADQLTYQDQLEERGYNRGQTAADRAAQIAGDIYNAKLYATENNLFGYNRNTGGTAAASVDYSSGSSSSGTYKPPTTTTDNDAYGQLMANAAGTGNGTSTSLDYAKMFEISNPANGLNALVNNLKNNKK